jgi:hypothetical protein
MMACSACRKTLQWNDLQRIVRSEGDNVTDFSGSNCAQLGRIAAAVEFTRC